MKMKRRAFIEKAGLALAAIGVPGALTCLSAGGKESPPHLSVSRGNNLLGLLEAALAPMNGMGAFVGRGDKVVILPNPQGNRPGVSTSAVLVGEAVRLCLEAGAAEVTVASIHSPGRWFGTGVVESVEKNGGRMHFPLSGKDWLDVRLPAGSRLRTATIIRKSRENDVLINMPIVKQHDSTKITASLKNLMGFNLNNQSFHQGEDHIHESIAELASLFTQRLIIVDAFTILAENGPFGPGRTISPQSVVVGTDAVAVDAYCCRFFKLDPNDVGHIRRAHQLGLGENDVSRLRVVETPPKLGTVA